MITPKVFLFFATMVAASSATAEKAHYAPLNAALSELGQPHLYKVGFPTCAMDFELFSENLQVSDVLLRATSDVDLANGYFRGTWALRLPEEHELGAGNYLVIVECGSGLGKILASPN